MFLFVCQVAKIVFDRMLLKFAVTYGSMFIVGCWAHVELSRVCCFKSGFLFQSVQHLHNSYCVTGFLQMKERPRPHQQWHVP